MNLNWMDRALCAQTGPDAFFPEGIGQHYRTAKKICARCPVRTECAAHAKALEGGMSRRYRHGAWGGTAPLDREKADTAEARDLRDTEIRRLVAARWDNARIAAQVGCGERTVIRVRKATS